MVLLLRLPMKALRLLLLGEIRIPVRKQQLSSQKRVGMRLALLQMYLKKPMLPEWLSKLSKNYTESTYWLTARR
jgi:hypothetical protein